MVKLGASVVRRWRVIVVGTVLAAVVISVVGIAAATTDDERRQVQRQTAAEHYRTHQDDPQWMAAEQEKYRKVWENVPTVHTEDDGHDHSSTGDSLLRGVPRSQFETNKYGVYSVICNDVGDGPAVLPSDSTLSTLKQPKKCRPRTAQEIEEMMNPARSFETVGPPEPSPAPPSAPLTATTRK